MNIKRFLNFVYCGVLALFICSCSKNNALQIVENGESNYEIVFLGEASKSQHESAKILQNYLHKISNTSLTIIDESSQSLNKHKIYIGNINGNDLEEQQISIKEEDNNLFINGGSDEAIRYAVYQFLERFLNCKWYAPEIENIPKLESIAIELPISYEYNPEIKTRTVHSRLFYKNHDFADKLKVTHEAFPYYVPKGRVHTFNKFIPEESFYKSHPEYFALRGNKRLPTQLCLTNNDVVGIVKDSVKAMFESYPESSVISVSSNDNTQYCTCDNCKQIDDEEDSHAGTMIRFVNKIADAFPDKTISTLAYQYTRKPCITKPADNVLITLCSIECDRSASIEDKCVDFANDLKGWHNLTDNIRIWDYTTQFTNFLAPFPNLHTLKPNIEFFKNNNAKWVFEQHSNNPSELFELRSYVTAKLLWNPDLDFDELVSEFTDGYYHEAGSYVKQYVDIIHSKIKEDNDFFLFLYGDPSQAFGSYLSPELLTKYSALFDEAEEAVAQKPEILNRVKVARISTDYAILEACRKNISDDFNLANSTQVFALLENFKTTCDKASITLMNEMGYTVSDYYGAYKKAIVVANKPNKAIGKPVTLLTKPKKYANEDPQALTDGALGGSNFYSNWLGFEGNDLEAIVDLEEQQEISSLSAAFLQVTNHIVFFPTEVTYSTSTDGKRYTIQGKVNNKNPLTKKSKVNDIQYFNLNFNPIKTRYIKIRANSMKKAPYWHHGAGLPSWIFADEIIIN